MPSKMASGGSSGWLQGYPFASQSAPALVLWLQGANLWLLPVGLIALAALLVTLRARPRLPWGAC
jgi:hypothetical protein